MWIFKPYSFANTNSTNGGYFDGRPSFSYGCSITIWIGARRIGKTFSGKHWLLEKCVKNENVKFAWLRDSDEARLKLASNRGDKFFSDCKKMGIPNINGYIEGETINAFGRNVGYLMPSSTFQNYKGNDFDDIKYIVFDEFIAEKGVKLKQSRGWEILNMMYTICSTRKDVRILMLANALDRNDEFLKLLDVNIKDYGIYVNREKSVCIHYCDDHPDFIKAREESVMGKIIKGTVYEENLFRNKFSENAEMYYDKRPPKCNLLCILHNDDESVRVYYKNGELFGSRDFNLETQLDSRFASRLEYVKKNIPLAPKYLMDSLKEHFSNNNIKFDNSFTRKIFMDLIQAK